MSKGFYQLDRMLSELLTDVEEGYRELEGNRESQRLRRTVVRAVFVCIEGLCEILSYHGFPSESETERPLTAKELKVMDGRVVDLKERIKCGFSVFSKAKGFEFSLDIQEPRYSAFIKAKGVRTRVVHPKKFSDLIVSLEDMAAVTSAYLWAHEEFTRAMRAWSENELSQLPAEVRAEIERELRA